MLESRSQYRPCHVRVPDLNKRLAAILVDDKYYSFFRIEKDSQRALEITNKLTRRGDQTVITKTAKGYVIWVLEPEACPEQLTQDRSQSTNSSQVSYKLLESRSQYQPCQIRVPDLDKRLSAILVEGKYYSLFRVAGDRQKFTETIAKLNRRNDETVVTRTSKGFIIWVLEPEAYLDQSAEGN